MPCVVSALVVGFGMRAGIFDIHVCYCFMSDRSPIQLGPVLPPSGITNQAVGRVNACYQIPRCRNCASFLPGKLTPGVNDVHHLNAGRGDPVINDVVRVRHDFTHGRYGLTLPVQVRVFRHRHHGLHQNLPQAACCKRIDVGHVADDRRQVAARTGTPNNRQRHFWALCRLSASTMIASISAIT